MKIRPVSTLPRGTVVRLVALKVENSDQGPGPNAAFGVLPILGRYHQSLLGKYWFALCLFARKYRHWLGSICQPMIW
jgi:hypothetical protein